jgi:type IV pilus assembly protein PilB
MHITHERLKTLLLDSGLISQEDFASAEEESRRSFTSITDVLLGREQLREEYLMELLKGYFGVSSVDLKRTVIPQEALESLPEAFATSHNVVIFELTPEEVKVATLDPFDYPALNFIEAKLERPVRAFLTYRSSLRYALKQYKKKIGLEFNQIIQENIDKSLTLTGETDLTKLAEAVPIVTIVDSIIEHAISVSASDIHFEPLQKELLVRYRVDGMLQEALTMPKIICDFLVARIKILANLQIDEHRVPQDGRARFEMDDGGSIDIRVNVMPVMYGEKVEMRLLKSSTRPLTLDELGLSPLEVAKLQKEIQRPHGMILVTGPTGHGKTTTLYSVLHILNTTKVNITTIEDPIEYEIPHVNQTQVNTKAGITFANGLRSLLRQNPDIIMIGEIRDAETVDIAVHAALTGHLVLSSLHTNDAPSALPRLLDMGAPAFLLASTVNVVVAQRLIRKICLSCIESKPLSEDVRRLAMTQLKTMGITREVSIPTTVFYGRGCKVCGDSGFVGQVGIFEILVMNEEIRSMVLRSAPVGEVRQEAIREGMTTMFEDGLAKVEKGITTLDEVLRVAQE